MPYIKRHLHYMELNIVMLQENRQAIPLGCQAWLGRLHVAAPTQTCMRRPYQLAPSNLCSGFFSLSKPLRDRFRPLYWESVHCAAQRGVCSAVPDPCLRPGLCAPAPRCVPPCSR